MRTTVLLSVLALAATGCGGATRDSTKEFEGEEQKVAAVVEQIEKAARADDPDTVCERIFTADRLKVLEDQGTNCKTGVKDSFKDADSFDITVDDVTITGDTATARITSGTGSKKKTDTLSLKRQGTAWRVDSLQS